LPTPEAQARELIDEGLRESGWTVQSFADMNLAAAQGLAVTEFPGAHGPADYLLYVDGKAIGVVEAKPVGHTLKGVEGQSASYADGLAAKLPAWRRPLPFQYESTGQITQFTNWMEPLARSRDIFAFPETLLELVGRERTVRGCLREMEVPAADCALSILDTPPPPSAVIFDNHTPELGGLEVLKIIRANPVLHAMPVVMFSADGAPTFIAGSRRLGAQGYFVNGNIFFPVLINTVRGLTQTS
jgi:CheY-like chemotaxis protein